MFRINQQDASGASEQATLTDFPELTREDLPACCAFPEDPGRRIRYPQNLCGLTHSRLATGKLQHLDLH